MLCFNEKPAQVGAQREMYRVQKMQNSIVAWQGSTLHDEKLLNASVTLVRCYRYETFYHLRSFGMTLTTVTLTTAASTAASTAAL